MAYEQKDNNGALFKNADKTDPSQPDYRGNCMVDGKLHDIAAWIKPTKKGDKFMSLSFKPSYKKGKTQEDDSGPF